MCDDLNTDRLWQFAARRSALWFCISKPLLIPVMGLRYWAHRKSRDHLAMDVFSDIVVASAATASLGDWVALLLIPLLAATVPVLCVPALLGYTTSLMGYDVVPALAVAFLGLRLYNIPISRDCLVDVLWLVCVWSLPSFSLELIGSQLVV